MSREQSPQDVEKRPCLSGEEDSRQREEGQQRSGKEELGSGQPSQR